MSNSFRDLKVCSESRVYGLRLVTRDSSRLTTYDSRLQLLKHLN
jgi:hypothetical protein